LNITLKDKVLFFDLDDTLIIEEASAADALLATTEAAQKEYGINTGKLYETVRIRARELWHAMPIYQYWHDIGISSWEGLWVRFIEENEKNKELIRLIDTYQINAWHFALLDFRIDNIEFAKKLAIKFNEERRKRHAVFPEVFEILERLFKDYRLGIITNGLPDLQWEKIKGSKIENFFENVIISGDVGVRKPQETIFLTALNKFNSSIKDCVMIGNNLNTDILGASTIGLKSIWINRNDDVINNDIIPDYTIKNLIELPDILNILFDN